MTTNTKTTSILKINGMKCHNCAGRVEKEVRSLAGVYEGTVDLAAKTVKVTYDAAQIDPQSMAAAIENMGHGYEVIKD
ncbi:heavy metal-associated domain-containing protein [Anaerospora hongkongensis]|uniref:heavy-metal-associated domain-containing protein n=1 Tax=Anaerospora hongkongensis TaxID=244830 RepID=UPI002897F10A|nr:heavy metal-associated domain-containing protein [Anaerospora hongkongensis]